MTGRHEHELKFSLSFVIMPLAYGLASDDTWAE